MRSTDSRLVAFCAAALLATVGASAHAQSFDQGFRATVTLRTASANAYQDTSAPELTQEDFERRSWGRAVIRVGQDYALKQGESVSDVVVVFSPAVIEGYVRGNVNVVFGTVRLGPTAVIAGSLVVIGGNVTVDPGASVREDMVVIGGGLDAPSDFVPGREHIAIGATAITERLRHVVPWITEGLLLGRPIVPRLGWVWVIVLFVFLASLGLCLLFTPTVRRCADTIAAKPVTTFLVGLLVLLLTGPVSVVLAASVIGIAVVPFVLCAVVVAWLIGKVAVAVRLGDGLVGQQPPASRLQTVRSFVIGFAAVILIYMVPVLGFITWAVVGVTGLGAASLAFASTYRRENPAPPKPVPPPREPLHETVDAPIAAPVFAAAAPAAAPIPNGVPSVGFAGPVDATNLSGFPKARFVERASALALDTAFILIVCGALDLLDDEGPGVVMVAMLAYHVGFWAWKSTTFGGIVCQLRVVRLDGSPLRPIDAIVRGIASFFSLGVAGLGFLWILKDEERQAWHDKIAGTYVVSVPRN